MAVVSIKWNDLIEHFAWYLAQSNFKRNGVVIIITYALY